MKEKITRSSGNVFTDLGFPPEEAAILAMRADLMAHCAWSSRSATGRRLKPPKCWALANRAYPI